MHYIIVPGWTNSGPDHWQTHLANEYSGCIRVEQDDWDSVTRDEWIAGLDRTIRSTEGPLYLVGHSCGSVAAVQWAAEKYSDQVVGALIVAPADVDAANALVPIQGQRPLPEGPLPMRTHLIVSDNDPHLQLSRARELAAAWGASIECIPGAGHFATADGFGRWPYIAQLIPQLSGSPLLSHP